MVTATSLPPAPTPTDTPSPVPAASPQPNLKPKYDLRLTLDYAVRTASVEEVITYTNQTGETLNELVLAVEYRLRAGAFELKKLSLNETPWQQFEFKGQRMTIRLDAPLLTGESLRVGLVYSLNIPRKTQDGISGYDVRQINLIDWYPFIVPYKNGWILHEPRAFGEHLVYEASNFDVRVRFTGSNPPIVAASAPDEADGEWTHYHLEGARVFFLSASKRFLTRTAEAGGVKVTSYIFEGHESAGERAALTAAQALNLFSQKFGPYPYPSLSIVEIESFDGLEGGSLFFLPLRYYEEYDGTWQNKLTTVAVHETAHAWWFGSVGNDQALEPWLDEALAMYSERIYFEQESFDAMNWWWNFRVRIYEPDGFVDNSIYEYGNYRMYTNATYRMGAYFLDDLRARVGTETFLAFLYDYAQKYSSKIATRQDFFALLNQHSGADYADLLREYFKAP
jgi:aminopeptidase N